MKRIATAAFVAAILIAGQAAAQQPAPAPSTPPLVDFSRVEIKTTDLGNKTYMLEGMGGNITVALAETGVIMVDAQFAPLHDKIKAAIEALSKQPIKYLINTHLHGDHTGGNGGFAKVGATIVGHENLKTRLAAGTVNGLTGARTPGAAPEALPAKTYQRWTLVKVKDREAELRHFPNAHTDGDTYVYFANANVLATGDIVSVGNRYPNIDFANGGHIKGMIAAVDAYIALANDRTKVVPGHGPVMSKADLIAYRQMLATAHERVAALIAQGKTADEAVAAKPFAADLDKQMGANEQGSGNFVRVIYFSLKPRT
jgi:cyclase